MSGQHGQISGPYQRWVIVHQARPHARLRLFCFPHAGGGASVFREWYRSLPEEIEVCAVQLPGRENRLRDQPIANMVDLIGQLSDVLEPALDRPYALFGHSMGALIAFEFARRSQQVQNAPLQLFLSGRNAPKIAYPHELENPRHRLSKDALIDELRLIHGTPTEILDNQELMAALLPTLRADFALVETYAYGKGQPLSCPIHAFGGDDDTFTSRAGLDSWAEETEGAFQADILPGDHFFIASQRPALLRHIARDLARL